MDSQESAVISQRAPEEPEGVATELERASQKLSSQLRTPEEPGEFVDDPCEDTFPPPSPPSSLGALSPHKYGETEAFPSIEDEVGEWISDGEAITDPTEDLASLHSRCIPDWIETPEIPQPVFHGEASSPERMSRGEEHVAWPSIQPDGVSTSQTENNMLQPARHFPSDINDSEDVNILSSPPFADESKEEQLIDIMSCQNQLNTTDSYSEDLPHASSDGVSDSDHQDLNSAPPAGPSTKQQEELLPLSHPEFAPRGEKPETAQQVLGQRSPPLWHVVMEPSNEGGAASHGSVGERHGRAGGRRNEGGNEQTGGEEGQKDDQPGGEKTVEPPQREELFRDSQTAPVREFRQENSTSVKQGRVSRMENDTWDENQSDSGVSMDFSPYSTMEGTIVSTETPIEREIRRSVERENSLRRSRGLPDPTDLSKYVEIPLRKAVGPAGKSETHQNKDRELAGKMMQHDIHEETQREQDLVRLGKVPGVYSKGTVRQMKERKHIFEAFQAPSDSNIPSPARSKTPSWSSASVVSNAENSTSTKGGLYTDGKPSPTWSSGSAKEGLPTKSTSRGPGFSEGSGIQVIILENDLSVPPQKCFSAKPEANGVTVVDSGKPYMFTDEEGKEQEEEEEDQVTPKENPFFKLRSSTSVVKVQQDIQETHEREKELRKQRRSLYGSSRGAKGDAGGGRRSNSVDGGGVSSPSSLNGVRDTPWSPPGTGLSAAHQSVGKFCVRPQTQAGDEKTNRPEVPAPPWSPRQKTPLVQRWESALINGHDKEDD